MKNKIHFIGIGGIGVSALARYFLAQGAAVSGSDLSSSEITDGLKKLGVKISIGPHKAGNVPRDADTVIYSPAVQKSNPELKALNFQFLSLRDISRKETISNFQINSKIPNTKYKIPVLSYPQALGELMKRYFTIAVSGSHGKSTTTAMLANILIKAGFDPTVIVGTKLKEFGDSNFRAGQSRYLVIEADEWNGSFLNYWPKMIVLTNIDREHLDYYKNLKHIVRTFKEYVNHLPKGGMLVANGDDKNIQRMLNSKSEIRNPKQIRNFKFKTLYFGKNILKSEFLNLKSLLRVPGEHNVYNALAALAAGRALKTPDKISFQALSAYRGAWRRFEMLGKFKGADVISDYAHHPTEVMATLAAARQKYPKEEIWCVFQPHQFRRTEFLFKDFVSAFDAADKILLLDIYGVAGREKKGSKASSEKLALEIKKRGKDAAYFKDFNAALNFLKTGADENKTVLIMGAGDIWKIGKQLTNKD